MKKTINSELYYQSPERKMRDLDGSLNNDCKQIDNILERSTWVKIEFNSFRIFNNVEVCSNKLLCKDFSVIR